jgi:uracil-DNA glycosylase family 4
LIDDDVLADLRGRAEYYETLDPVGIRFGEEPAAEPAPPPVAVAPAAGGGLDRVREDLGDCRRCKLAGGRRNIVFGQGNPNAKLMFVGEAPGADEDIQGLAFVGRAGQLLTRIIEAMGLRREEVWIGNVLMCRPPENRNPEPDEIDSCQPFLEAKIAAIRPRVIVGLGKFGAQWLLQTAAPITRIRGHLADYPRLGGIKVMPTYHPAYLLRNPAAKKDVWEDMKIVRGLIAD